MSNRVTYIGHGTVAVDLAGTKVVTDPLLRARLLGIIHRRGEADARPAAEADAILISHLHPDHLDFRSLAQLGRERLIVGPPGSARVLARRGFRNAEELAPGETARVGALEIAATHAAHDGRRWPVGRHRQAIGFEIHGGGLSAYYAGDTDLFEAMGEITSPDVALLPIGGWGPRVGRGHLDARRAAQAAAMIGARLVVPVHWGTFLRADLHRRRPELLSGPAAELRAQLAALAPGTEARILSPGESLELGGSGSAPSR